MVIQFLFEGILLSALFLLVLACLELMLSLLDLQEYGELCDLRILLVDLSQTIGNGFFHLLAR